LYYTGHGVSQDYLAAARWYQRAARRGHGDAQSNLAALYINGYGVPQDHMMAYAWFNQAAMQSVGGAEQQRDRIAARLTPEQIQQARQLVLLDSLINPVSSGRTTAGTSGYYGPVVAGETLWSIAGKVKPAGASTRAMVTALMRTNPEAFAGPAPDSLKINARLRIPLEGKVVQFSAAQVAE
jgi:FimV-like protein